MIALFVLLLIIASAYFAFFSSFFNIKKVEVIGAQTLKQEDIIAIAKIKIDSNLILQNTAEKSAMIKENFSRIQDVSVKRSYPNTMIISVEEKQPLIIGVTLNNFILIDDNGEVIDVMAVDAKPGVSKINAPILSSMIFPVTVTQGQILVETSLRQAIAFVKGVPEDRKHLINEIRVKNGFISIYPTGDFEAIMGDNKNMIKKLNTLETLLKDTEVLDRAIAYMDLSVPDRPIIKEQ
ncbi:hypothetical protein AZF37_02410 [endosymbiont 'TC1' of Trimyema compressum]|uniref:cell division protein FtsQ/DivIB n=1 Tax=endosymbiont 'TC1' of Trimyema compressum TaxID=243899 RepID=UPI0007F08E7C|nr:FtsQ-type POTRA domain-containing protein [endosymbiont 'TC1' of Trimyema compressum]AMP20176.1 hypothetical protein AZF37_02410 [endosymbiont 'TC1' of Trimyema compressum]